MASSSTEPKQYAPIEAGKTYARKNTRRPKLTAVEPAVGQGEPWWFIDLIERKWYAYTPDQVRRLKR